MLEARKQYWDIGTVLADGQTKSWLKRSYAAMRILNLVLLAVLSVLSGKISFAQQASSTAPDAQPAPANAATPKTFQWNAELDAYALGNLNDPASGMNDGRSFDNYSNAFRLAASTMDLDYKSAHLRAHLTGGYGDQFKVYSAADSLRGANSYLSQYYVTYQPLKNSGLLFDFGKFYTSVGAEVVDSQADLNYSRSFLFTLGEPLYHFGMRVAVPVTKTFTVGTQVVNGWNNVADNNRGKTLGFTSALTRSKWSWSQVYLVGPEKTLTNSGKRQLINESATFSPRDSITTYVELLYGRDKRAGLDTGADAWYGAAAAARWNFSKKFSVASRSEYYVDQTGFTSGISQRLTEATATLGYAIRPNISTKLEYREDISDRPYFKRGLDGMNKQQGTIALAVLVSFKGER